MFNYHARKLNWKAKSLFAAASGEVFSSKNCQEGAVTRKVSHEGSRKERCENLFPTGGCSADENGLISHDNPVWQKMSALRRHESLVENIPGMELQEMRCKQVDQP